MPGTFAIDCGATFVTAILMSAGPKMQFGSTTMQDTSAAGLPKWAAEVAVTFSAEPGMRPVSEVISVTVTSQADPFQGIDQGASVVFEGFRVGISAPEKNDRGGVRGGKPWYQAAALRRAGAPGRSRPAEAAA
jgi:hypothetical protein